MDGLDRAGKRLIFVSDRDRSLRHGVPGPRSLASCLPWIWSQLLFPAQIVAPTVVRWRAVLLLLVLPGVLLYPCLDFHLFEPDEGRYAEIPREMLVRGDWVVPYLQGEAYLDKPPLFYWLIVGSYQLLGIQVWTARLVPALAVHACVLLTYLIGRRSLGEPAAFWGALALSLAPGFISVGRLLVLDGLLALWVTLALLSAFEAVRQDRLRWHWWLLAAAACGLGVLTKGPIALILVAAPIWLYRRLAAHVCRIGGRALLVFAAVVLAVPLPWFIAICWQAPAFASHFFWEHNVIRFLAPFDHLRPFWFYGPILLAGLLPATWLTIPFLRFLFTADKRTAQLRSPELGFMLLAGGWCVLFFSLSGCKLPTYVLPAFPPLALAFGYFVANSSWRHSRWTAGFTVSAFVLLLAGHYLALPWYARYHSPLSQSAEVARYCADRTVPVICYPRNCDSVAFFLGRDDLRSFRSKQTPLLIRYLQEQPRAVILFTHRHSLESLRQVLPSDLHLTGETPLCASAKMGPDGMCYMAVVEQCKRR